MKTFLYLLLCLPSLVFAQYSGTETDNIRIDPEWLGINAAYGFVWAYDIAVDKSGNTYSTGYFKNAIVIDEDSVYSPNKGSGNHTFLFKRNQVGELQWARYILGGSRPSKLAIDKDGFIHVIGFSYSRELVFTTETDKLLSLKRDVNKAGIFTCKYDADGHIIQKDFLSRGVNRAEHVHDFLIDNDGNYYVAGSYIYYQKEKPGNQQRSYLLSKFDKNLNTIWQIEGDTIGNASINGLTLDAYNNIFITGFYNNRIDFDHKTLESEDYHQIPFVAKLDKNGNLRWINEDISITGNGVGINLVVDKVGNSYIITNTSYSFGFITKVNQEGEIKWRLQIKRSVSFQDILIDDTDNIYVCGEGYGAKFISNGSETYSYKSRGSTDFFMAEYSSSGVLKWLKVGGGKTTDYCKGFALQDGKIYTFGWTNGLMDFKKTKITTKRNTFWAAQFDLQKLRTIDLTPMTPYVEPQKETINTTTCECQQKVEKMVFAPGIDDLATPKMLKTLAGGWTYVNPEILERKLFYKHLQSSLGSFDADYYLVLLGFEPIEVMHADGTFSVNLAPYLTNKTDRRFYEIPTYVKYGIEVRRLDPSYDYEDFDSTTLSYYQLLENVTRRSEEEILYNALFLSNLVHTENYVKDINRRYQTDLYLREDGANKWAFANKMVATLENINVDFEEFMLHEFILSRPGKHVIDNTEKRRLASIFWLFDNFCQELKSYSFDCKKSNDFRQSDL